MGSENSIFTDWLSHDLASAGHPQKDSFRLFFDGTKQFIITVSSYS